MIWHLLYQIRSIAIMSILTALIMMMQIHLKHVGKTIAVPHVFGDTMTTIALPNIFKAYLPGKEYLCFQPKEKTV